MSNPEYLFDNPNVYESHEGDVIPPSGEVTPMPGRGAEAELRQDHPFDSSSDSGLLAKVVEVEELPLPESEEDTLGLKTSDAPLMFRLSAHTRILGREKTREIKNNIKQRSEAQEKNNFNGRDSGR
jgi:hypothetical protein